MLNEADTCKEYVIPRLQDAGWYDPPHAVREQLTFTDGRIVVAGDKTGRREGKRADYVLRFAPDFPIAVVEAKRRYKAPGDGLQQAKDYAEILGLRFAYSTNGAGIVEFDYLTGQERTLDAFPTPAELWARLRAGSGLTNDALAERLLAPSYHDGKRGPRYYQEIAVNRSVQAVLQGRGRLLITMATGAGKTMVAFQICWKLWTARWNRTGEYRRPRILFLADRNVLIDDPYGKDFLPFAQARHKIEGGDVSKSREMYFSTYQAIAEDESRPGLFREYARDFFDLIVIDECHRGSARRNSTWRDILEYFQPAAQLGLTATPLRQDNRDTYDYFGAPVYQYTLRQGIEDGFLAPFRLHRIMTDADEEGWQPSAGERDRYGREIPDEEYETPDFERKVALQARTEAIARHISDFMRQTGRFAKTIVFCVDQEHALEMRQALINCNSDLVRQYPNYVARVTANEGAIGRGHLSAFQDVDTVQPVILTTSQMLTTGVDAPTCKNVVLVRVINSMTEFKQIIGRGTRVRADYGKLSFNILDYTGSASRLFADPDFDGDPVIVTEEHITRTGEPGDTPRKVVQPEEPEDEAATGDEPPRKFYYDGGRVEIVNHAVMELDPDGARLRMVSFTGYTADKVRTLWASAGDLRLQWADLSQRKTVRSKLKERGIDLDDLAAAAGQPDADPFDLLCHLAFNAPLRTRRERADKLRRERHAFFEQYTPEARAILYELLEKYADHGLTEFSLPDTLKVAPISDHGNVSEIIKLFGGGKQLRDAVEELQVLLYAA